jgi:hypothetical protein
MKGWMDALGNIIWLTQLGLSMLLPPVGCLWICYVLVNSFGAPIWIYIPLLALGIAAGAKSFWDFYKILMKRAADKKEGGPLYFNRHS